LKIDSVWTGDNNYMLCKAAPTPPYYVEMRFRAVAPAVASHGVSLLLRDSVSGKLVTLLLYGDSGSNGASHKLDLVKWNSRESWNAAYTPSRPLLLAFPVERLRIVDDGTDRHAEISADGADWLRLWSAGRTDFMTPNQVGFGLWTNTTSGLVAMTAFSFKTGTP
jgi:hypothetical protein